MKRGRGKGGVLGLACLTDSRKTNGRKTDGADTSYTLVEILYLGDMLLWNQMKLKMTPMVLVMRSS